MQTRRLFLKQMLSLASMPLFGKSLNHLISKKTNIILILADDIGYECFGCYGSSQYKTPRINELAESGMRFTQCFSQPLCTPSRVEIMTGQSNVRNYVDFELMSPSEFTFGHMFQRAGYVTGCTGKWQLFGADVSGELAGKGMHPSKAGFNNYCLWQVEKKTDRYWGPTFNVNGKTKEWPQNTYGPDVCSDFVEKFLENHKNGPFFFYYPMLLVHSPYLKTPESRKNNASNEQKDFEDMVCYMDKMVGKITDKLEDLKIRDRTLILFAGDNGTEGEIVSKLGDKIIKGSKGKTIDSGMHVPLIANLPGTVPSGRICDDMVNFTDFFPTMADFCSVEVPQKLAIDGKSFASQLLGKKGNPREYLYCYFCPRPSKNPDRVSIFVRDRRWKLYSDGRLYNLSSDINEKHPIEKSQNDFSAESARKKLQSLLKAMPTKGAKLNLK